MAAAEKIRFESVTKTFSVRDSKQKEGTQQFTAVKSWTFP